MSITVKQAREALEAAKHAHATANVEHSSELLLAKGALTAARHNYWNACADFCTKLEFSVDLAEVHEKLVEQGLWV